MEAFSAVFLLLSRIFSVFILICITFLTHVRALRVPDRGNRFFFRFGQPPLYGDGFLFPSLKPHTQSNCLVSRVLLQVSHYASCACIYTIGDLSRKAQDSLLRSLVAEIKF